MRYTLAILPLCVILLSGSAHALRLTDGLYFTVAPNSSAEVIFLLPEDIVHFILNLSTGIAAWKADTERGYRWKPG